MFEQITDSLFFIMKISSNIILMRFQNYPFIVHASAEKGISVTFFPLSSIIFYFTIVSKKLFRLFSGINLNNIYYGKSQNNIVFFSHKNN